MLTEADIREKVPTDSELVCPIDNKLFRDAVKTPCCGTLFCEECIQTFLLENEFNCRQCGKKVSSLDKLIVDKPMRARVFEYIDKTIKESEESGDGIPTNGADMVGLDMTMRSRDVLIYIICSLRRLISAVKRYWMRSLAATTKWRRCMRTAFLNSKLN